MDVGGALPAALSAAVLGSRNSRRQVNAVLAHASEWGAYSVGFALTRSALSGFTIYMAGNCVGVGGRRASLGTAAHSAVPPLAGSARSAGQLQPNGRSAAPEQQRQQQQQQSHSLHVARRPALAPGSAGDGAASAPATARRQRGCRGGAKRRARRVAGGLSTAAAAASTCNSNSGGSSCVHCSDAVGGSSKAVACVEPPAPSAPPKGLPLSLLSPSAPSFTPTPPGPPPPPPCPPLSLPGGPTPSLASSSSCGPSRPRATPSAHYQLFLEYERGRAQDEQEHACATPRSSQKRRASSSPSPPPPPPPVVTIPPLASPFSCDPSRPRPPPSPADLEYERVLEHYGLTPRSSQERRASPSPSSPPPSLPGPPPPPPACAVKVRPAPLPSRPARARERSANESHSRSRSGGRVGAPR